MKFLIVGCGSIGRRHLENLKALSAGEIAVFDTDRDRALLAENNYGVRSFASYEAALAANPDAVLVCTPTSLHLDYALAAVKSDSHVFIEKPISHSLEGLDDFASIARDRNRIVLIGCNFRFHWGIRLVKQFMEAGKAGKVLFADAEFGHYLPDWHPWEDYRQTYSARKELGGGIIFDSIHELDYLYWLFGKAGEVFSSVGKVSSLEIDVEDIAEMTVKFDSGVLARVHLDYIQRAYHRSLKVVGEEGVITWDLKKNTVDWYAGVEKFWHTSMPDADYNINDMYVDEMKHFISCLKGEASPLADAGEGKSVLQIALAARRSSEAGKAVSL